MPTFLRVAPLALALLPFLSRAQVQPTAAVGLEVPAPAPPSKGHFLTGAYVVGAYSPLPSTTGYGYGVQPYLRYQLGTSAKGRLRPYVQYTFTPYRMPMAYGTGLPYGTDGTGQPVNPGFAPLAWRNAPLNSYNGYNSYGNYGGLGAFSVGIPMQIGRGSAVLSVGGSIISGLMGGQLP